MRGMTVLGTGCAMVTKCYNTCFVLTNDGEHLLVDAGGGNQVLAHLEKAGIPVGDIHDIFVSHRHNDHTVGMIWMVRAVATLINKGKYEGELRIHCTPETEGVVRAICHPVLTRKFTDHFDKAIRFVPVSDGDERRIIGADATFFDIGSTKDEQFGFAMTFPDGYRLTYLGDEPYRPHTERHAKGADLLLHEAYCLYRDREKFKPYEKHHATAKDAAENAEALGAKALLLYHTEDAYIGNRRELFEAEAREHYNGRILVPEDLEVIGF